MEAQKNIGPMQQFNSNEVAAFAGSLLTISWHGIYPDRILQTIVYSTIGAIIGISLNEAVKFLKSKIK
ncbi:MAG TPA: hypothetical protein PLO59_00160 [Bacteroidia bacterium]|nr:hypothetical protein [Bacteroidia bacterium]